MHSSIPRNGDQPWELLHKPWECGAASSSAPGLSQRPNTSRKCEKNQKNLVKTQLGNSWIMKGHEG